MAADVEVGRLGGQYVPHPFGVPAGIAADVGHKNIETLDVKSQIFGKTPAQGRCVYIAVHGTEGFEGCQPVRHFHAADVSGVPDFITRFEMGKNAIVQKPMRVGK